MMVNWDELNAEFRLRVTQAILYVEELAIKEVKAGAKRWLSDEKFKVACDLVQEKLTWLPRAFIEAGVQLVFNQVGGWVNALGKEPEKDESLPSGGLE